MIDKNDYAPIKVNKNGMIAVDKTKRKRPPKSQIVHWIRPNNLGMDKTGRLWSWGVVEDRSHEDPTWDFIKQIWRYLRGL